MVAVKGTEVSLAIDLVQNAHQTRDKKDSALVICGEGSKYKNAIKQVKKEFGKKIKMFSLSHEYEENNHNFMDFISNVGKPIKGNFGKKNEVTYIKPYEFSDMISVFNESSLRQRMNSSKNNRSKKDINTFVYIDYGNIHHCLLALKRREVQMKSMTELDFLLTLKRKAMTYNKVNKICLFMGTPLLKIDELEGLRQKNEALKSSLEENGFEVHFSYNEVLFKGGMKEQGVDLTIGIHIINAALIGQFEKVILISGDADFVPVVRKLKELQKEIEIWSFTKPEKNAPLSPYLIVEMSKHGDLYRKIKSINTMLYC